MLLQARIPELSQASGTGEDSCRALDQGVRMLEVCKPTRQPVCTMWFERLIKGVHLLLILVLGLNTDATLIGLIA
jgi:hypothetical protein